MIGGDTQGDDWIGRRIDSLADQHDVAKSEVADELLKHGLVHYEDVAKKAGWEG